MGDDGSWQVNIVEVVLTGDLSESELLRACGRVQKHGLLRDLLWV